MRRNEQIVESAHQIVFRTAFLVGCCVSAFLCLGLAGPESSAWLGHVFICRIDPVGNCMLFAPGIQEVRCGLDWSSASTDFDLRAPRI